jgi:hypothetical protein
MTPTLPTTTQAQHMAHFNELVEQFDSISAGRYDRVADCSAILRFMECKFGYYSNEASQFRHVCLELGLLTPEQCKAE